MKVYVVSQNGCFRASFIQQEEAEAHIAKRALFSSGSRWTIDTYEVASGKALEAPVFASPPKLRLVR